MCFESKTRVSALVPCELELYLELRRFISMGEVLEYQIQGNQRVIVPYTYATIAYVRDNAVYRMKYPVRE